MNKYLVKVYANVVYSAYVLAESEDQAKEIACDSTDDMKREEFFDFVNVEDEENEHNLPVLKQVQLGYVHTNK